MIFIGALSPILTAAPAQAVVRFNGKTVCVKESLNGDMDRRLSSAIRFVDRYTGSRIARTQHCGRGVRILTIRVGRVPQVTPSGRTYAYTNQALTVITIDPSTPHWARVRLLEHELGHAFYLHHSTGCDIMKAVVMCHGRLVPERFTATQRTILARH